MHFIPQNQVNRANQKKGVVIPFKPSLKTIRKHTQPCIFCGTTVKIQTFKGKAVCTSCCEHIPALFIQKPIQVQLV